MHDDVDIDVARAPCRYQLRLKTKSECRESAALKRLASAVRFRPWPPCFQSLTVPFPNDLVPIGSKTETNSLGLDSPGRYPAEAGVAALSFLQAALFSDATTNETVLAFSDAVSAR